MNLQLFGLRTAQKDLDLERWADEVGAVLAELVRWDAVYSAWYRTGSSRKAALARPVEPSRAGLLALLQQKTEASPKGGHQFSLLLWNGGDDP